jgi:hypothetical protein
LPHKVSGECKYTVWVPSVEGFYCNKNSYILQHVIYVAPFVWTL